MDMKNLVIGIVALLVGILLANSVGGPEVIEGPIGPQGPAGAQGPMGPQGPAGAQTDGDQTAWKYDSELYDDCRDAMGNLSGAQWRTLLRAFDASSRDYDLASLSDDELRSIMRIACLWIALDGPEAATWAPGF